MNKIIDVVIPAHKKDLLTLGHCIDGIRKNIADVRRIIVVSKEKYTDKAEWFDESLYPFSYSEISDLLGGKNVGWNFQQLLKLYAPMVIPNISENVLIVDSDTVFYRKTTFFQGEIPLYNISKDKDLNKDDFYLSTLSQIKEMLPEIAEKLPQKFNGISGICHHMLFQKHIIQDLMTKAEIYHNKVFYKALLDSRRGNCGMAEYNLYFYFLICCHPENFQIRELKYKNTAKFFPLFERLRKKYHYCSYHSYMRDEK